MSAQFHNVYAGRAVFQVPVGVELKLSNIEVGQVSLEKIDGHSKPFEALWAERVALLRSGQGERYGKPVVSREFAGDHTVFWYANGVPNNGGTLEHWQQLGRVVVKGQTVITQDEVPAGLAAIKKVFDSLRMGETPVAGDFAIEGGVARMGTDGAESIDAEWIENILADGSSAGVPLKFSLTSAAVATPGRLEVLNNLKGIREDGLKGGVRVDILRQGKRTAASMDGEESIVTFTDGAHPESLSYAAKWQSVGVGNDGKKPAIEVSAGIDHFTGKQTAGLSAQWDAMLRSLHFQ